jgi:hypothetical protein
MMLGRADPFRWGTSQPRHAAAGRADTPPTGLGCTGSYQLTGARPATWRFTRPCRGRPTTPGVTPRSGRFRSDPAGRTSPSSGTVAIFTGDALPASPLGQADVLLEDELQGERLVALLVDWSGGLQLAVGGAVGAGLAGDGDGDRHRAGPIHQPLHRNLALGQREGADALVGERRRRPFGSGPGRYSRVTDSGPGLADRGAEGQVRPEAAGRIAGAQPTRPGESGTAATRGRSTRAPNCYAATALVLALAGVVAVSAAPRPPRLSTHKAKTLSFDVRFSPCTGPQGPQPWHACHLGLRGQSHLLGSSLDQGPSRLVPAECGRRDPVPTADWTDAVTAQQADDQLRLVRLATTATKTNQHRPHRARGLESPSPIRRSDPGRRGSRSPGTPTRPPWRSAS